MNFLPRNLFVTAVLLLFLRPVWAVPEIFNPGTRSAAMGGTYAASSGAEGLFLNQAALAFESHSSLLLNYESRFLLREYSFMSAGMVIPVRDICIGAGYRQFGTGFFRQMQSGLAAAKRFGRRLSAGINFNYLNVRIPEDPDNHRSANFEAGMIWQHAENLSLGIHYVHPFPPDERSGTVNSSRLVAGESWQINELLNWSCDLEWQNGREWRLRSGLEYRPVRSLFLRVGIRGLPFQPSGGMGFRFRKYSFDLAFSYHGNLGFSPAAGLVFRL